MKIFFGILSSIILITTQTNPATSNSIEINTVTLRPETTNTLEISIPENTIFSFTAFGTNPEGDVDCGLYFNNFKDEDYRTENRCVVSYYANSAVTVKINLVNGSKPQSIRYMMAYGKT